MEEWFSTPAFSDIILGATTSYYDKTLELGAHNLSLADSRFTIDRENYKTHLFELPELETMLTFANIYDTFERYLLRFTTKYLIDHPSLMGEFKNFKSAQGLY